MPNLSLLFARTLQDADDSAWIDWKWDRMPGDLYHEWRRPDNYERVRFVPNMMNATNGLRWHTKVYLGRNWMARVDHTQVQLLIDTQFFDVGDPELPPPRKRRDAVSNAEVGEIRKLLHRMRGQPGE